MLTISHRLHEPRASDAQLVLPFDLRSRSRFRARLVSGEEVGVILERGQILRGGDLLLADDGRVIQISAASETVSCVRSSEPQRLIALPIIWAIDMSRCRSGRDGCDTVTITCWIRWCSVWA